MSRRIGSIGNSTTLTILLCAATISAREPLPGSSDSPSVFTSVTRIDRTTCSRQACDDWLQWARVGQQIACGSHGPRQSKLTSRLEYWLDELLCGCDRWNGFAFRLRRNQGQALDHIDATATQQLLDHRHT